MSKIIEYFKEITQIPHCSEEADRLKDFLVAFAKEREYTVEVDESKNIYVHKGMPKLSLQAHYDMVCMGKAPCIETYIEEGFMMAKNSSLGADNAMAIAMMMEVWDRGLDIECILTSDEEIGLIGANALDFDLKSDFMLNLDSEDEAEVYIGCAGGVDIVSSIECEYEQSEDKCYEISLKGLVGGHSGVDIDKGIDSAITLLGKYLHKHSISQIASIYAGERRNSIPANAVAIVCAKEALEDEDLVKVRPLKERPKVFKNSQAIVEMLYKFEQGVRSFNEELNIPHTSINLAIISCDEKGGIMIESSLRAMDNESLMDLSKESLAYFSSYGFSNVSVDKYPSWKPEINEFTKLVDQSMREVFHQSKFMAIHAGLECGVIAKRYPNIKFASIGPTIMYPHSTRERVDIASVEKTFEVLEKVIAKLS